MWNDQCAVFHTLWNFNRIALSYLQIQKKISDKPTVKGPGAKNDTSQNPGSFNQILSFESRKGSPVATF